ncbi:hypothetical protein D9M68_957910 [compost metagenome]
MSTGPTWRICSWKLPMNSLPHGKGARTTWNLQFLACVRTHPSRRAMSGMIWPSTIGSPGKMSALPVAYRMFWNMIASIWCMAI